MTKADMKAQAKDLVAATKDIADESFTKAKTAAEETAKIASGSTKVFEDTTSIIQTGATDWQVKLFELTKTNLDANFAFATKLLTASNPMDAFNLQKDFAETRMTALQAQTQELGALASKVAEAAAKPAHQGMLKSFDEAKKAFAA